MANKRIIFLILFFITLSALCAQNAEFYSEMRFFQRLSWSGDEYAKFYEVIVEKEIQSANNVFERLLYQRTNDYTIEVSLSPGKYRFRVIPYDYLDTPGEGTQWIEFEVYHAYAPHLHDASYKFNYTGTEGEFVFNITGSNIEKDAEIKILTVNGDLLVPDELYIAEDRRRVLIVFYDVYSIPDVVTINIINPGGLGTSARKTIVFVPPPPPPPPELPPKPGFNDKNDRYFGLVWMPLLVTYRYDEIQENTFYYEGAALSFSILNKTLNALNFGFEINLSYLNASGLPQFIKADFNLLAQVLTPKNLFGFRFKLGAGAGISSSLDTMSFHLNFGYSFLWFFIERAYIELGIDSVFWNINSIYSGGIRPFIGIGWMVN